MLQYLRYSLPPFAKQSTNGQSDFIRRGERKNVIESSESVEGVTKVCAFEKQVALGTERGHLWLLEGVAGSSKPGVQMRAHLDAVRDISWDGTGQFVATCGDDGVVSVVGRAPGSVTWTAAEDWDGVEEQAYGSPLKCIRLDPRYATRRERYFLAGGKNGELVRHCRGWFGTAKDTVLASGDGAIETLAWAGPWAAWATMKGVKICHVETGTPVALVPRPASSDFFLDTSKEKDSITTSDCCLFWYQQNILLLGWGDVVMRLQVKVSSLPTEGQTVSATADVLSVWRTDCFVSGLCPFDQDHVVILGIPPASSIEAEDVATHEDRKEESHEIKRPRPELQIARADDGTIVSEVALPFEESCLPPRLATTDESLLDEDTKTRGAASWLRTNFLLLDDDLEAIDPSPSMTGQPPRLYIYAPNDVIICRVREADDAIDLALKKNKSAAALAVAIAQAHRLKRHRVQDLVKSRLDTLLANKDFETAATECKRLLGHSETLWEYWILVFDKNKALSALAPQLPMTSPRLAPSVYDMVLERLLATDPKSLRLCLKQWLLPNALRHATTIKWSLPETSKEQASEENTILFSVRTLLKRVEVAAEKAAILYKRIPSTNSEDSEQEYPEEYAAAIVEAQAELLAAIGEPEKAVHKLLNLPSGVLTDADQLFDLIDYYELYSVIRQRLHELAAISRERCANLLMNHFDHFAVDLVFEQFSPSTELQLWYLRLLFSRAPEHYANPEFKRLHAMHVELSAEYAHIENTSTKRLPSTEEEYGPDDGLNDDEYDSELLRFLKWSSFVPLDDALTALERQTPPLYDEIVYVLGRMGQHRRALNLLLHELNSVKRSVNFVEQYDTNLWDDLIEHALKNERFLAGLLDYADVSTKLIQKIPHGMRIPNLKAKLLNMFEDYRFQLTAFECCATAAKNDTLKSLRHLYALHNRGTLCVFPSEEEERLFMLDRESNSESTTDETKNFTSPGTASFADNDNDGTDRRQGENLKNLSSEERRRRQIVRLKRYHHDGSSSWF